MRAHTRRVVSGMALSLAMAWGMTLRAETVGYWRFEDAPGFTADSSGRGYTLTAEGTAPTQVGAESGFDNPLPQNGLANLKAGNFGGAGNLYVTDKGAFNVGRHLTVEAYFRVDAWPESVGVLAGQFAATLNQQAWFFGVRNTGVLVFRASSLGNTYTSRDSSLAETVVPGKDYYAAVVFDGPATKCTFFLKNLTDGGSLLSQTVTDLNLNSLFNSNARLNVGAVVDASTTAGDARLYFDGRIDEVRISDTSLIPAQLLVSAPVQTGNTVGYWRFENAPGFLKDSGTQGLTLSRTHATWPQAATPGIGSRVPLTRATNAQLADFGTNQLGWLSVPTPTAGYYVSSDFTVEAFVRQTTVNTNTVYVLSQWDSGANERGFALFVGDGGTYAQGELCLSLSSLGSDTVVVQSDWDKVVEPNKDIYLAASFDESDQTAGVTFYYRNLTDGGPLLSKRVGHSIGRLHDSVAALKVGTLDSAKRCWLGGLDEARLTCAVLPEEQLLGFSPPPAGTVVLIR